MSYESFGSHEYLTHNVVIGALPVVMIKCAECGWVRGDPGQEFDDIWERHIQNAKASDRALMAGLKNKLLQLRERIS